MTVRSSDSKLMTPLENALDENENVIGPKVFEELEKVFNSLDDAARELENDLEEAQDRIRELEEKIEELGG
ncbi:hypothetical protein AB6A23_10995 [Paenibacillus tarimensis]